MSIRNPALLQGALEKHGPLFLEGFPRPRGILTHFGPVDSLVTALVTTLVTALVTTLVTAFVIALVIALVTALVTDPDRPEARRAVGVIGFDGPTS